MDRLERWELNRWSNPDNVLLWYRYIDDVFYLWRGPDSDLRKFHHFLHSFHDSIEFTLKVGDHSLNFLDITISLSPDTFNDGFLTPTFSVYRKPT